MFADRKDAGEKLAHALEKYRGMNVLVLGIPRGGAEIAYYVARHLNTQPALVITRKLGHPLNPEAAFGAVAEDGSIYISETAKHSLTYEEMNEALWREKEEINRRIQKLRRGHPLPHIKGRTIIIVDDGIATGATLFATIQLCKNKKAQKLIVASPIAGKGMENILQKMVDEVVILEMPTKYSAVSQGYENFHNLTDEEALAFIDKWENEHLAHDMRSK